MPLKVEKCKDNPRTTWVVLVCCKIYRWLWSTRTAGQPIGEKPFIIFYGNFID